MSFSYTYKVNLQSFIIFLFLFFFCYGCNQNKNDGAKQKISLEDDLKRIRESGVLKVAVDYNSTNYFVYRGKPMGYQYDLIQALCKELEVKPEIIVSNNMAESFEGLKNGMFDLIAKNLTVTRSFRNDISFTNPHCPGFNKWYRAAYCNGFMGRD
jgi:membrane-bound lytic murein transglycosylase F